MSNCGKFVPTDSEPVMLADIHVLPLGSAAALLEGMRVYTTVGVITTSWVPDGCESDSCPRSLRRSKAPEPETDTAVAPNTCAPMSWYETESVSLIELATTCCTPRRSAAVAGPVGLLSGGGGPTAGDAAC